MRLGMRLQRMRVRQRIVVSMALCLVSVAEDKRFELLSGCPQYAFQVC